MAEFANWQWVDLEETSSTNDEVKRLCAAAPSGKRFMVAARRQNAGRGRRGRGWVSLEGNLFVSFGLEVAPQLLGQMTFVVGLSLLEAVRELAPQADVCLKWPNDVLVGGGKVSGILLEKAAGNYLVVGVGVNIVAAPQCDSILYPVVSLKQASVITDRTAFLHAFVRAYDRNLDCWENEGFAPIRENWLKHAKNLGAGITVNMEKERKTGNSADGQKYPGQLSGGQRRRVAFLRGIAFLEGVKNGVLLLETPSGIEKIYAGDIFYLKEKENK